MQKSLVLRRCISCRKTFDRGILLKITNDRKLGIVLNGGIGRSAYICKSNKCNSDSKIKKKLQKALRTSLNQSFLNIFELEIANYK